MVKRPWMTVQACRTRMKGIEDTITDVIAQVRDLKRELALMQEEE